MVDQDGYREDVTSGGSFRARCQIVDGIPRKYFRERQFAGRGL
jgi:hypothetical protein